MSRLTELKGWKVFHLDGLNVPSDTDILIWKTKSWWIYLIKWGCQEAVFLNLFLALHMWGWLPGARFRSNEPNASDPLDGFGWRFAADRIQAFLDNDDDTGKSQTVPMWAEYIDLKSTRIKPDRKVRSYSYIEIYSNQLPPLLIDGAQTSVCVILCWPFCSTVA